MRASIILVYSMPSTPIPDFSDDEIASVQSVLAEKYDEATEIHLADMELKINQSDELETSCPVIFWNAEACNFAILRTGKDRFQARYFYTPDDQHTTKQVEFTSLQDSLAAVMQAQSSHHQRQLDVVTDESAAAKVGNDQDVH